MPVDSKSINVAILGASGYTGAELVRLLHRHGRVSLRILIAEFQAGMPMSEVFPHLAGLPLPGLTRAGEADWSGVDVVFCGLPHEVAQEAVAALPGHLKVIDLSAGFRLADTQTYARWYGAEHRAPALQAEAVYGLTELARDAVRGARLVANPGCYPTASLLPLVPLVEAGLVEPDDIVIDAKSGVSGAGRAAKESSLFAEVSGGLNAYGVASHRHAPEIEQGLSAAAGKPVTVSFTPHLAPMNRGILASIYLRLAAGASASDVRAALAEKYDGEPFVRILDQGDSPSTRQVRGSNLCLIGVFADRIEGRVIVLCAIDNLVKGASGQAVQNMNLMFGLPETAGLESLPLFP